MTNPVVSHYVLEYLPMETFDCPVCGSEAWGGTHSFTASRIVTTAEIAFSWSDFSALSMSLCGCRYDLAEARASLVLCLQSWEEGEIGTVVRALRIVDWAEDVDPMWSSLALVRDRAVWDSVSLWERTGSEGRCINSVVFADADEDASTT